MVRDAATSRYISGKSLDANMKAFIFESKSMDLWNQEIPSCFLKALRLFSKLWPLLVIDGT